MYSTLVCVATRAPLCAFFLVQPTTGISFFLAGPGPLHENALLAFDRVVHWAVQRRCHSYRFLNPPYISKHSPSFAFILSASLSPTHILSFTSVLDPPTYLWTGYLLAKPSSPSTLFPLPGTRCQIMPQYDTLFPHIYATFFHVILPRPFVKLSDIQLYQLLLATSSLACSLKFTLPFQLSRVSTCI